VRDDESMGKYFGDRKAEIRPRVEDWDEEDMISLNSDVFNTNNTGSHEIRSRPSAGQQTA
jgi:hypothetical protein